MKVRQALTCTFPHTFLSYLPHSHIPPTFFSCHVPTSTSHLFPKELAIPLSCHSLPHHNHFYLLHYIQNLTTIAVAPLPT
jgi:hypothetical protein